MTSAGQPTDASKQVAFFEALAKIASTFFRDPLSDTSRRRQSSLLVVSLLSLLLALAIITIGDVTAGGIKVSFVDAQSIKYVLSAVTLYFAIVYLLSAFQDLKAYSYSVLAAEASLLEVHARLSDDFSQRVEEFNAASGLSGEAIAKRQAAIQEHNARMAPLEAQLAELIERFSVQPTDQQLLPQIQALQQQLGEERRNRPKFDDGLDELQDEMLTRALDRTITKRMRVVVATLQSQRHTSRARQWIEVIAPVVFAGLATAVVWATR